MSSHESDLYFKATPESLAILERYPIQKSNAQRFRNKRPPNVGESWVDVPFAYDPWWEARQQGYQPKTGAR